MVSFRILLTLFSFVSSATALARDCVIVPAESLCGVSLSASQAAFEKSFGEPDGRINMGKDRVGLLYGTNFVVIFSHGKIWEIENWQQGGNHWLGYVGFGRKERETTVLFKTWNPWESLSNGRKKPPKDMPIVDGDETMDSLRIRGGSVDIVYEIMANEIRRERWKVISVKVNFNVEPHAP